VTKRLRHRAHRSIRPTYAIAVLIGVAVALIPIGPPAAASSDTQSLSPPLPPPLVVLRSFAPPTNRWDAGNRGVDLAASSGEPVFAGASGRVIYAGVLAGRGVISIDDGSAHLTYEPVDPLVTVGSVVVAGALIGQVADELDDCGPPGSCLHWGVRTGLTYLDPLALLRTPKVRLLPIWSEGPPTAVLSQPTGPDAVQPGTRRACEAPQPQPECW
jgi:murein DD-endopeptidase MepM/ murein hydrolase activator NlpD